MNMRARFGLGLFAGLLLGFLIVGSTSLYSPSQSAAALFVSHEPAYQEVATSTASSISSAITAAVTAGVSGEGASNSTQVSLSTVASISSLTTATATTTGAAGGGVSNSTLAVLSSSPSAIDYFGVSGAHTNGSAQRAVLASEVDNLPRQPLLISLAAFLPVVAAVLFGAVIYRVSMSRQDEETPPAR